MKNIIYIEYSPFIILFLIIIDAVFTYLCGQRIWDQLPCVVITGCGYPPLSVRAMVKTLSDQFQVPVVGLFDYNVRPSIDYYLY